jgi:hypothetical protein
MEMLALGHALQGDTEAALAALQRLPEGHQASVSTEAFIVAMKVHDECRRLREAHLGQQAAQPTVTAATVGHRAEPEGVLDEVPARPPEYPEEKDTDDLPPVEVPRESVGDRDAASEWERAVRATRAPDESPLDAVFCARVREAGAVLDRDEAAARVSEALYEAAPVPDLAFAVACAHGRAGNADRAIGWLETAIGDGYRDRDGAMAMPELRGVAERVHWG